MFLTIKDINFSQRNEAMESEQIFSYSEDFLNEIIDDLIQLKTKETSNPKNNEFNTKLKLLMGKSFDENQLTELISLKDQDFRQRIIKQFNNNRDERTKILGEKQSKEIEKRILLQSIDLNWKSHIQYLEQLRQVVGLRSYGQEIR